MPALFIVTLLVIYGVNHILHQACQLYAEEEAPAMDVMARIDLLQVIRDGYVDYHINQRMEPHDPPEEIFRWDSSGQLHITGRGYGYVATRQRYRNYRLVIEYRWGKATWGDRSERARDSGLLLHAYGPHGAYSGTWMASIEAQIIEGGTGDILVLSPTLSDGSVLRTSITCEVTKDRDGELVWQRGAPRQLITKGRVNWKYRDVDWQDRKEFRGEKDVERRVGEWNRFEVISSHGTLQYYLNDELVNEGFQAQPQEGRIALQTEAAELFVRRFELLPLQE